MHTRQRDDTIWTKASGADFKESIVGHDDKEMKTVVATLDTTMVSPVLAFVPFTLNIAAPELSPKQVIVEVRPKAEISPNQSPAGDLAAATWEDASWQ
jgi:hypothetical protein